MKNRIKLNGIVLFLSILALAFFPRFIIRQDGFVFDDFWEVLGISLILAGQLLRVSARGYKTEQSRNGSHLVVTGPYSMVRNPMYLGIIMIGCGVVLAVLYPWTLLIFLGGFIFRYKHLFEKEEKILLDAFGKEYKDYCARVPRIIPEPLFVFQNDISSLIPVRLSWVKPELLSILLILAAVFVIESWEEIRLRGWGFVIPGVAPLVIITVLYFLLVFFLAKRYENTTNKSKDKK
ncbi:MAG: isoprenylcysteine carboxylmethyltransferase family protein [Candidatus Omnitrophota bacterium]